MTSEASPAEAASISTQSTHRGHVPSSTSWPLENVDGGYLNRN